jgi:hypothetical protein
MKTGQLLLIYGVTLVAIATLALLPLLSAVTAGVLADINGCLLDEGTPHPCLILGSDWGDTLYNMSAAFWLMLFTLPAGVLLFTIWLVVLVVHLWRRRK